MIKHTRLRTELGFPAEKDGDVTLIRSMVIAQWESLTKRPWQAETGRVELHTQRTTDNRVVLLDLTPVSSITQVRVRYDGANQSWTTLASTDYLLVGDRRLRYLAGSWPFFVEATYSGGYTEAPEDIQSALIIQAKFVRERIKSGHLSVKSQNFEGGGGVFEEAFIHPTFKALANLKKRKA